MRHIFLVLLISSFFSAINAQQTEKAIPTIDHIAFYVKNLDTSIIFYSNLFRLDTLAQPFKGARVRWFKINPEFQFHLIEGAKNKVENPEFSHLCFSIKNIDKFIETLGQNGIIFLIRWVKKVLFNTVQTE